MTAMGGRKIAREPGTNRLFCTLATACCIMVLLCVISRSLRSCGAYGVTVSQQGQLLLQGPATIEKSPQATAKASSRVALVTVGFSPHDIKPHMQYMYWTSVASKKAYAAAHGYPLYIVSEQLSHRLSAWDKMVAIKSAMKHSGADWVWCTDSDAYIMNQNTEIETVIDKTLAGRPHASVIMSQDCNGLQSGSFLVRNTPWLQQHLSQAWLTYYSKDADAQLVMGAFGDQGAFAWLYKMDPAVRQHYAIVPQRTFNSYPDVASCADESGYFKDGDLLIHFPGDFKKPEHLTAELFIAYMNKVPITTLLKYTVQPDSLPGLLSLLGASKHHRDQGAPAQSGDIVGISGAPHQASQQSQTDAAAEALAHAEVYTLGRASAIHVCKNATSESQGKQARTHHRKLKAGNVHWSMLGKEGQLVAAKLGRRMSDTLLLQAKQQEQQRLYGQKHMEASILVTMAAAQSADGNTAVSESYCVSVQRATYEVHGGNMGWPVAMPVLLEQILQLKE